MNTDIIHPLVAHQLILLKQRDDEFRNLLIQEKKLSHGYHPEMQTIHEENAEALTEIIQNIGYPTLSLVGEEANQAAWLIIQHAISKPDFMKWGASLLQQAVNQKQAPALQLAYLQDRIAVLEGKPQLYGTNFDWDEKGKLSPLPFDDIKNVNNRRKDLGLPSLKIQTKRMRDQAIREHQNPPRDIHLYLQEKKDWQKKVGWI